MIRKWYALWLLYLISDKILKLMHTFWCDVFIDFSDFAKDYINYHYRFWKALPPNNLTLLAYNEVSYIFPFHLCEAKSLRLSCMQWWKSTEYSASRTSGVIETINIDLKMMRIILRKSFVNLVKHMLLFTASFALWFLVFSPTLRCYVLQSVSFYPRSPDCPRVVEDKINQSSSVKLSLPFFFSAKMARYFPGCSLRFIEISIEI